MASEVSYELHLAERADLSLGQWTAAFCLYLLILPRQGVHHREEQIVAACHPITAESYPHVAVAVDDNPRGVELSELMIGLAPSFLGSLTELIATAEDLLPIR